MNAALVIAALLALAALAAALFRPGQGPWARWRRARRLASRVRVEDALKHVQEAEHRGLPATLHSLAGALEIPVSEAAALATRMAEGGLLRPAGERLAPTASGRDYALQVIRAHRLWERYLADETGVAEAAWHAKAERQEHRLSPGEADALEARLGHPRFDPHGDPIPTRRGELPQAMAGVPLGDLPPERDARIVHLEDEPADAYARLVAAGLEVGARVRTLEGGPETLRFRADGREVSLPRLLAAGVTVVEARAPDDASDVPLERLSDLVPGERAEIASISRACRGLERRRLMDLGVVPGTPIEALMTSPTGDPTAYRIRGTTIAIRRRQAESIRVRRRDANPEVSA